MTSQLESFLYAHPFLASFAGILTLLLLAWAVASSLSLAKRRRDRPLALKREALESAVLAVLDSTDLSSFAASSNLGATHIVVTCLGEPSAIAEARRQVVARVAALGATASVHSIADASTQALPEYSAHLLQHRMITSHNHGPEAGRIGRGA